MTYVPGCWWSRYFNESIIDQGTAYRYAAVPTANCTIIPHFFPLFLCCQGQFCRIAIYTRCGLKTAVAFQGFQGAIRDPLQDALPLIHTRPDLVRAVLRYSLKEQQPHIFAPPGAPTDPSDLPDSVRTQ
jgi:hypothetical protein